LVISREVIDPNVLSAKIELGCVAHKAVLGKLETAINPVEQIKRFSSEFQLPSVPGIKLSRQAHVGTRVIWPDKRVPASRWEPVVVTVIVVIGVADNRCIDGASAARGYHS
jgi:hypothetical protein